MLIGERYGKLTVISLDGSKAICRCDCGNTISVFRSNLSSGKTRSCGCMRIKRVFKPGERFGMLTVLSEQEDGKVLCRCDCGNEVSVSRYSLSSGNIKSCGCLQKKRVFKPGERYGMLTVLSEQDDGKVLCRCDCGNEVSVLRSNLSSGNTSSCGCLRKKHVISPGDRFGMLTVISLDGSKATCRCDCGKTVTVFSYNLSSGNTMSCGCQRNKTEFHLKPGDRFGMLTILSDQNSRNILCRCDCGNEVSVRRYSLTSGNTRSCGCQRNIKKYKPGDRSTSSTPDVSITSNPDS